MRCQKCGSNIRSHTFYFPSREIIEEYEEEEGKPYEDKRFGFYGTYICNKCGNVWGGFEPLKKPFK